MKYFFRRTIVSGTVSGRFNGKMFKALVLSSYLPILQAYSKGYTLNKTELLYPKNAGA